VKAVLTRRMAMPATLASTRTGHGALGAPARGDGLIPGTDGGRETLIIASRVDHPDTER
jgi:hypothetical protein